MTLFSLSNEYKLKLFDSKNFHNKLSKFMFFPHIQDYILSFSVCKKCDTIFEDNDCFCFFKKIKGQCVVIEEDGILSIYILEEGEDEDEVEKFE